MQSLKKKGYTKYQNNHYCQNNDNTTTCFCSTGNQCNDDTTEPQSGASSNAGGVFAMAGAILLARVV